MSAYHWHSFPRRSRLSSSRDAVRWQRRIWPCVDLYQCKDVTLTVFLQMVDGMLNLDSTPSLSFVLTSMSLFRTSLYLHFRHRTVKPLTSRIAQQARTDVPQHSLPAIHAGEVRHSVLRDEVADPEALRNVCVMYLIIPSLLRKGSAPRTDMDMP